MTPSTTPFPCRTAKRTRGQRVAGVRILGTSGFFPFRTMLSRADPITIGRAHDCDIPIPDTSVSWVHCHIGRGPDGGLAIFDCNSSNGVYLATHGPYSGFRRIDWHRLELAMHIRLGAITLLPVDAAGAAAVVVQRESEFHRHAGAVYRSHSQIARHAGLRLRASQLPGRSARRSRARAGRRR